MEEFKAKDEVFSNLFGPGVVIDVFPSFDDEPSSGMAKSHSVLVKFKKLKDSFSNQFMTCFHTNGRWIYEPSNLDFAIFHKTVHTGQVVDAREESDNEF